MAGSVSETAQSEVHTERLGRGTPRGAVLGFLGAARRGDDELAAQFLNTRVRGNAAAALAHQLFIVLDRRLPPRLNQVSDDPEASLSYPLKPYPDLTGTIRANNGKSNY